MCGSVDMSYACLSLSLSVSAAFLWYFFSRLLFFCTFQLNWTPLRQRNASLAKCAMYVRVCCVFVFGCKLKRSSSHTKTTTRTSALMLHLPCLFTASCPFVGHTHMCENGFYFNPFSFLLSLFSLRFCCLSRWLCALCCAHPSALIAFDCSPLPPLSLSLSVSLSSVLCLCVVLLIYAINWHNLWPIVLKKKKKKHCNVNIMMAICIMWQKALASLIS